MMISASSGAHEPHSMGVMSARPWSLSVAATERSAGDFMPPSTDLGFDNRVIGMYVEAAKDGRRLFEILRAARAGEYAVPAFNVFNLEMLQAAYDAEYVYFRFQWKSNLNREGRMHDYVRYDGKQWKWYGHDRNDKAVRSGEQPALYEDRFSIMLDDGSGRRKNDMTGSHNLTVPGNSWNDEVLFTNSPWCWIGGFARSLSYAASASSAARTSLPLTMRESSVCA